MPLKWVSIRKKIRLGTPEVGGGGREGKTCLSLSPSPDGLRKRDFRKGDSESGERPKKEEEEKRGGKKKLNEFRSPTFSLPFPFPFPKKKYSFLLQPSRRRKKRGGNGGKKISFPPKSGGRWRRKLKKEEEEEEKEEEMKVQ